MVGNRLTIIITKTSLELGRFFMSKKRGTKLLSKFLVALFLLNIAFFPQPSRAGVSEAVSYLQGQNPDPWITMALSAAGQTDVATSHLQSVSGTLATDYAKVILALAAAGKDPSTFGSINYVEKLKTYYQGGQFGEASLLNDDIWSILALAAVGQASSAEVSAAKTFLLNNQNSNGGWSYAVSGSSDTNDTAAAIIALIEAGATSADQAVINAISYLQSVQNSDGGFGWETGSASDSGSDAWVISAIYKIGQDPNSWQKGSSSPVSHLQALQDSDGGFWWLAPGTTEYNNKAMTPFVVIALAGKSYPVGYFLPQNQTAGNSVRIEGQTGTICDVTVTATTALNIIEAAASVCGYTYEIKDTTFGKYLNKINEEAAQGMSGWLYFVNNASMSVGAADYNLQTGDKILWYYGDWGWSPLELSVSSNTISSGQTLEITVKYFDGQNLAPLPSATVKGGDQDYTTNDSGKVSVSLNDGYYTFYAEKSGYVRSNRAVVMVGSGVSQLVDLTVEVDQSGRGQVAGEAIIFEISSASLNFGKIKPGQSGTQSITLSNSGTVDLQVLASVAGDAVFTNNLKIDGQAWPSYQTSLNESESKSAALTLPIPTDYFGSGIKNGQLTFWAQSQN